jgi:RNA polymerase sigma factor (sigma-70 family)
MNHVLSPKQYQYVQMYYVDGLKMTEIAERMNVNKSTVSRTISRAKQRLQHKISPLIIGDRKYIYTQTKNK